MRERADRASRHTTPDRASRHTTQTGAAAPVRKPAGQPRHKRRHTVEVKTSGNLAAVVHYALAQVGKRYVWGTAGPDTYDCSGLLVAAWARIGIRLPHQSGAIARLGRAIPRTQWIPGTVLAYSGHIAIYLGGGKMVHAANPRKGVLVSAVYGSPQGRLIG